MEMGRARLAARLLRGVGVAALWTFPGMALLAVAVVLTPMSDGTLTVCNQLMKALCIFLGALSAVGAGGERGFVTGAAVGLAYALLGYGMYCALDGGEGTWKLLGLECALGCAVGAVSGAICANLRPRRSKRRLSGAG